MNQIDSGIDLRALRALVAIADGGSFRAAAGRLGYSQSAISHRVAELLPSALRAFRRDWPGVEVVLSENDRFERLGDELARGRLDLAFARDVTSDERVETIPAARTLVEAIKAHVAA